MRKAWTDAEREVIRQRFVDEPTKAIAADLGRSYQAVACQAALMGLKKSPEYLRKVGEESSKVAIAAGAKTQFKPGHRTWNTGKKGWTAGGRSGETRFKPGSKPQTWVPIGTEVTDRDGYTKRKVADDAAPGMSRLNWKFVHVLVWEEANGPVPPGHIVVFKDRNKSNLALDNLECISRAENARRNTIHRYGPEVVSTIRLVASVRRRIAKREQA